ncbi:MAG: hypothetical protein COB36_00865 [Alphaproteobacteria bacterium]|nr:MAG: hypothetical protein COB36_00865 [Alphaproteobacteria bacterium]
MYHKITCFLPIFLLFIIFSTNLHAQETKQDTICPVKDRSCILKQVLKDTALINNMAWRDQTYREIAKTYAITNPYKKKHKQHNTCWISKAPRYKTPRLKYEYDKI